MRLEKWFISNLDDSQRRIIVEDIDKNIVVQGAAGSGKTNLAIHRALQAKNRGSYAFVILTIALKRMISYGMNALGLDRDRIAYDWCWTHRGFDMTGDVYWKKNNKKHLYLVNDMETREFVRYNEEEEEEEKEEEEKEEEYSELFGIDFGDWVEDKFYYAFGRRSSWFHEVKPASSFDITDTDTYELIPSGIMFKQAEDLVDYLIIDEAQDFNVSDYKNHFAKRARKSLSLFGDTKQQMNSHGSNIQDIAEGLNSKQMSLDYNYRLPKAIAKVAQQIIGGGVDLMSNNRKDGGNSDYPNYPKPVITQYASPEKELEGILARIQMEDLDDVAILVPSDEEVMMVNDYLSKHGVRTQVMYRTSKIVPFRTVNTLDFSNNDLPCILTYYAAKGSEFDNVFIPFANTSNDCTRNSFYVACTRSSRSLYISYSGTKTKYLNNVNPKFITELKSA